MTLVLLCLAAVLGYMVSQQLPFRMDLSRQRTLSLTDQSRQLLSGLQSEVTVTAFFASGDADVGLVLGLLKAYQRQSPFFKLQVIDPDRYPDRAQAMGVDTYGTMVFQSRYGRRDVYLYQLFSQDPQRQMPVFIGEQVFTGVLKAMTASSAPRIDVAFFGEERQIQSHGFGALFQMVSHDFRHLRLVSLEDPIPDPAEVLVVVFPAFSVSQTVIDALKRHLDAGKKLIVLADPLRDTPALVNWLSGYGVRLLHGTIMDPGAAYFNTVSTIVPVLGAHPITIPIKAHQLSMVLPVVGAMDTSAVPGGVVVTPLMVSSPKAWRAQGEDPVVAPGQVTGVFVLGALLDHVGATGRGRLLVVRDVDFVKDEFVAIHGNQDFVLNVVSTMLGQDHEVTIRPRLMGGSPMVLTLSQTSWVFVGTSVLVPFGFALAGVWVWWRRRS